MSLFTPRTSMGKWIGYQIIAGVGRGCAFQMVKLLCTKADDLTNITNTAKPTSPS